MTITPSPQDDPRLRHWMEVAGIPSWRALSQLSGVSRRKIEQLRHGEAHLLSVQQARQLADALQISLSDLLQTPLNLPAAPELAKVQAEYQRLQAAQQDLRSQLTQDLQAEVLHILEPLLLQWPTAAYAAQQNSTAPAVRILPLLRPLEQLLQTWHIEPIGAVGETVEYDPQVQQWAEPTPPPEMGTSVRVTHVGYRQGQKLLYRAKVRSPLPP
ncbi:MAG: helix-turn-helix domain-containing protein [Thermosynechococcaceae cyanobacterium]